jgi:Zn-dependent protease/CBS domain-containing protein
MGGSIKLLSIQGIPIRMHVTFPLILVLAAVQGGIATPANRVEGAVFGVITILLLFVCVVLHELAHSLVAMRFGTGVKEIVLLPLGGVARMERIPERPYQELLMALAGPVTSGLIGLILLVPAVALIPRPLPGALIQALSLGGPLSGVRILLFLTGANFFLAAFNLVPAFPMDGGRVLRALLASAMPYGRATAIAVSVGQSLAMLLGLVGLLSTDVMLILVALFVYTGATLEGRTVKVKIALAGLRVGQVYSHNARSVAPTDPLGRAVDLTLEGFQSDFPVCDGGQLVGLLTRGDVLRGLKEHGPQVAVERAMQPPSLTARPEDDLYEVQQRMEEAGLRVVPVVGDEGFLGLLTQQDLEEAYGLVTVQPDLLRHE